MMPHMFHKFLHVREGTTASDSRAQQDFSWIEDTMHLKSSLTNVTAFSTRLRASMQHTDESNEFRHCLVIVLVQVVGEFPTTATSSAIFLRPILLSGQHDGRCYWQFNYNRPMTGEVGYGTAASVVLTLPACQKWHAPCGSARRCCKNRQTS